MNGNKMKKNVIHAHFTVNFATVNLLWYTVRLLTHDHCKPTHFFFHPFIDVVGRIIAFPDDRDFIATLCKVAVNTVCRYVQRAVFEPTNVDVTVSKEVFLT